MSIVKPLISALTARMRRSTSFFVDIRCVETMIIDRRCRKLSDGSSRGPHQIVRKRPGGPTLAPSRLGRSSTTNDGRRENELCESATPLHTQTHPSRNVCRTSRISCTPESLCPSEIAWLIIFSRREASVPELACRLWTTLSDFFKGQSRKRIVQPSTAPLIRAILVTVNEAGKLPASFQQRAPCHVHLPHLEAC